MKHDFFISHASVDKDAFIRPITNELSRRNIRFWLDEANIGWGDSIALKINEGLRDSRFALICLSEAFCDRSWPETELSAVLSLQNSDGIKRVLPLILNAKEKVLARYPILAGFAYKNYGGTPSAIVDSLEKIVTSPPSGEYEIVIEAIHRGIQERLIVPERASIQWVMRQLQASLGLRDLADTGGFTQFPIRWVLVQAEAEEEWRQIPRIEKQRVKAVVLSNEKGLQVATRSSESLRDLGATHRSVFHVYAIEDDDRWPLDRDEPVCC